MTAEHLTLPQAKAMLKVLLDNPKVKAHFEAILGEGGMASVEDFGKQDSDALNRAEATLRHIDAGCRAIWDTMVDRPRQMEIDFDAEKEEAARKAADKEAKKKELADKLAGRDPDAVDEAIDDAKAEGEERTGDYEVPDEE